jgi:hypothetical protein
MTSVAGSRIGAIKITRRVTNFELRSRRHLEAGELLGAGRVLTVSIFSRN